VTDEPDLVGLQAITLMRDPPMTRQHANWLMSQPGAPSPVRRPKRRRAWDRRLTAEYVRAHFERVDDPAQVRGRGGRWAREPAGEPPAVALELREWIASGRAREIRLRAGLTVKAVAAEAGVAEATAWRWERGLKTPTDAHAAAYHALLARVAAELPGQPANLPAGALPGKVKV
jgi:DNA-binding XRE family transcriptional regulator